MNDSNDLNKAPDYYKDILPPDANEYIKKRVEELEKENNNANNELDALLEKSNQYTINLALNSLRASL